MRSIYAIILMLSAGVSLLAQKEIQVSGISFQYQLLDEEIAIQLTAPTLGWVGLGFNDQNSIVKSDLLLFHVVKGQTEAIDMYVVGAGNPQEDQKLGGSMDIRSLKGWEENGYTYLQFKLPLPSSDRYDFQHEIDEKFWLILAYSTHDDFAHHSRVRKHVSFTFTDEN